MTIRHAREYRDFIRRAAHVPTNRRGLEVRLVDGSTIPTLVTYRGGWYTRGGTPITHPSAYGKKGWSNMIYVAASDRTHLTVSAVWMALHRIPITALHVGL
jgi:hypothetical protein